MNHTISALDQRARDIFKSPAGRDPQELFDLAKQLQNGENNLEYARRILDLANRSTTKSTPPDLCHKILKNLAICTYKSPDQPVDTRLQLAGDITAALLNDSSLPVEERQDVFGVAGAIAKQRWNVFGLREHLETGLRNYRAGMALGIEMDKGYNAINAAFVLNLLAAAIGVEQGGAPLIAEADDIRKRVVTALSEMAKQPGFKRDFWFKATLGEAYLGLKDFPKAVEWMEAASKHEPAPAPWQLESAARQNAKLASLIASDLKIRTEDLTQSPPWTVIKALMGGSESAATSFVLGKVGLALSGGGFRAALYHVGVLARLAELNMLRHVEVISCVSGGSIVGAFYYLELRKRLQAKTDQELSRNDYLDIVDCVQIKFLQGVQKNIRLRMLMELGTNLRVFFSRRSSMTDRLAQLYDRELFSLVEDEFQGERRTISDILIQPAGVTKGFVPKYHNWTRDHKVPILILNATSLNTCHSWQFTATFMGEPPVRAIQAEIDANDRLRRMYYEDSPKKYRKMRTRNGQETEESTVHLSDAVAASACVPALFDPLVFDDLYGKAAGKDKTDEYVTRLVDGGAYDNQGVSSLLEQECTVLLVSDACGQTGVAFDPGGGRFKVMQRANDILMARVRDAQYENLASLRAAHVLRGLMYVHLKQDLQGQRVDWMECPDPAQPSTPGDITQYGIRRDVQLGLARIRTDLDSFSDCEADALMLSGYLITRREFQQCIEGFPVSSEPPRPWRFRSIETIVTDTDLSPDVKLLARALSVAEYIGFKPWRASPALKILTAAMGVLAAAGAGFGIARLWGERLFPWLTGQYLLWIALASLALWILRKLLNRVRFRNSYPQLLASFLLCLFFGWVVLRIHLYLIEPFYLKFGPKYRDRAQA